MPPPRDNYQYDSGDSALVGSRHRNHRRYRSHSANRPRLDRSHSTRSEKDTNSSRHGGFTKVALGVVFVEIVASCLAMWMNKRNEARDYDRKRERRRQFEKAKAKRRRDEEKAERRQRSQYEDDDWDVEEVTEVRRIGYVRPEDRNRSPSRSCVPRMIEGPDDWDESEDEGRWEGEKRRGRSNRT